MNPANRDDERPAAREWMEGIGEGFLDFIVSDLPSVAFDLVSGLLESLF